MGVHYMVIPVTRETNFDEHIGVHVQDSEGVCLSLAEDDEWHWISDHCAKKLADCLLIGTAAGDVLAERNRHVQEGWTPQHDDEHSDGALARAAACYAVGIKHLEMRRENTPYNTDVWPFDSEWWKPKDTRRNLVKAAALLIAEIERIDRAAARPNEKMCPACQQETMNDSYIWCTNCGWEPLEK